MIELPGVYSVAKAEVLTGDSPYTTKMNLKADSEVAIKPLSVDKSAAGTFLLLLPATSFSGISFTKGTAANSMAVPGSE